MANSVAIPQDIIDNIIEAVGDDLRLLKKCALVSSSFLLPSRKRLFSKISLGGDQACQMVHQFFIENPVIQSFVRSITIIGYNAYKSHSLIAILRLPFCCLESFSVDNSWDPWKWNNFSSELKDALSTIIHSSTLKTLYLGGVSAPIMLFHGIRLTELELKSFWLDDFESERPRLLTQATSGGVTTTASHTVIDRCVWSFYEYDQVRGRNEPILLPFMSRLRVFEIYVNPFSATMSDFKILSFLMRSLRVSLTSPATLEHIKFVIVFTDFDSGFNHHSFYDDLRDADVWSHLDSIISHPTGSRLQRVHIYIQYTFHYDNIMSAPCNTEVMQPVLDALPLLRDKGILFIEAYPGG